MTNPLPGLVAYATWLDGSSARVRGRGGVSAATYRRVAILRRSGHSFSEIADAIGRTPENARLCWSRLPPELR